MLDCVNYSTVVEMSGRPRRVAAPSVTSLVNSNRRQINIVPVEQHAEDFQDEEYIIEVDDHAESESDDGEDGEIFDENQP